MQVTQAVLSTARVEAIVKLLGEAVVTGPDIASKRRFILSGLSDMVGADGWIWQQARAEPDGTIFNFSFMDGGWRTETQRSIGLAGNHTPESQEILKSLTAPIHPGSPHVTSLRRDFLPDSAWYGSGMFEKYRKPASLDDFIFTYYIIGPREVSIIGLHNGLHSPPFTEEHRLIAHVITSQIDWLHRKDADVPAKTKVTGLSPRQRQIVMFLLTGDSVKQIASRLNLSINTVNNHLKLIHKHFGVSSRGELLSQFMGGGRVPPPRPECP
jgi:DNA-binding CsgD family transcriptional regulator